jgi:kynurenine formamidase
MDINFYLNYIRSMIKDFFKFIDLSHPLDPEMPTWGGSCGYRLEVKKDYDQVFLVHQIKLHASAGTHMDAPCHRFEHHASIGDIPLDQLIAPVYVLDVSAKAHADYQISVEDIEDFEKIYGPISHGGLVIGYTGWERFWKTKDAYRNCDAQGIMRFPSFSEESARALMDRKIVGLGIDTFSPDAPSSDYPVHRLLLGAGIYIIENVANALKLPPCGASALALPLYAQGASEAPVRLIGAIPKKIENN